jgi:hypothetical protein
VKHYCEANKLEPKALLLTDNTPSHPDNLETLTSVLPVEVMFLPSFIQPMDQDAIENFKLCYLRCTFKELIVKIDSQLGSFGNLMTL